MDTISSQSLIVLKGALEDEYLELVVVEESVLLHRAHLVVESLHREAIRDSQLVAHLRMPQLLTALHQVVLRNFARFLEI